MLLLNSKLSLDLRRVSMATPEEAKLERFLQWLQVNGVELRGCCIKYGDSNKGFGIYCSGGAPDGILLVVPLDLAITPMRVLQDPLLGPECRAMFEEGEVDDRLLMILFLMVERLRRNSSWKPYLDILPTTFGTPLWFNDDELSELRGTALYRATELQKKSLLSIYEDKVKVLVQKLLVLDGNAEREVFFEDFLWANSVFWSRALNVPFPHSYVFPQAKAQDSCCSVDKNSVESPSHILRGELVNGNDEKSEDVVPEADGKFSEAPSGSRERETIWVEGLVPAIDFCNHDLKADATWEVDGTGLLTGVPSSMFLLSVEQGQLTDEKEISISYGNKGNEELLYLYGFVINNNQDDYLMVHYPIDAIQKLPLGDSRAQLLEAQKAQLRCLLPKTLLDHGFLASQFSNKGDSTNNVDRVCNFSWSGHRRTPSYVSKLVFPEDFMTALRTIAMRETELSKVLTLLEELVGPGGDREPSDSEVRVAVWEACGDSGALQLLVDLLQKKMMDLEESTGSEECDFELLKNASIIASPEQKTWEERGSSKCKMSRNRWASIVYREGQKELTRLFLREAEHALQLSLSEGT